MAITTDWGLDKFGWQLGGRKQNSEIQKRSGLQRKEVMAQILSGWCQSGWLGHSKAASWEESRPSSNVNAVWIDRDRWIFRCTSFTWTIDFQVSAVQITSKSHMYPAQIIYQQSFVVLFAMPVLAAYALVDRMEQAVSKKSIEHCCLNSNPLWVAQYTVMLVWPTPHGCD